jgi:hypothetical protein
LINSILNNGFVTMSDNSKISDKKWSYPLWLPEPHPQPNFRRSTKLQKSAICRSFNQFKTLN